ncbi:uncharacterized protein CIMG_03077 [Coccidioides immitis RS]|uniref:Uncharacterized protein n=4 Tax=Coccidioides immitis TaxID=5501 RepID=J3KAK1_COCIM|nr:uncharacterized protein CIMG_03077 [Coccidioides immitis RS]EAS32053.3 hypothetical protein CIMG_03077 [Coccidioides immitis RS]KMP07241.1 hypothetical protein CIRG_06922 [Coccidioides immitis RMSCC 2394]KMU78023.1 hypothetical protein CISG_06785 [Coccidioides immitis RMSCC 3703]KMU82316.1 hypothetical protein CIHG_00100 [Coccidioides immitis H538.4]
MDGVASAHRGGGATPTQCFETVWMYLRQGKTMMVFAPELFSPAPRTLSHMDEQGSGVLINTPASEHAVVQTTSEPRPPIRAGFKRTDLPPSTKGFLRRFKGVRGQKLRTGACEPGAAKGKPGDGESVRPPRSM